MEPIPYYVTFTSPDGNVKIRFKIWTRYSYSVPYKARMRLRMLIDGDTYGFTSDRWAEGPIEISA